MEEELFDPDLSLPRIEFRSLPFDLRRVQLALFESTYRSPITLLFPREKAHIELATDIAMTVELAYAMYERADPEDTPAACYDAPVWYLRGTAHFTGPNGEPETAPMHVFLPTEKEDDTFGPTQVQVCIAPDRLKAGVAAQDGE